MKKSPVGPYVQTKEDKDAVIKALQAQLAEKDKQLGAVQSEAKVTRSVILPLRLAQALEAEAKAADTSVSAVIVKRLERSVK